MSLAAAPAEEIGLQAEAAAPTPVRAGRRAAHARIYQFRHPPC